MNKTKVIVIGINHAGTHSVVTLAENYGDQVEIMCYDINDNISFLGCGMALWISDTITDSKGLFYADEDGLTKLGAHVKLRHEVKSVDYENKQVIIEDLLTGEEFRDSYDKLIIGTGSWPILPKSIPGLFLENVHYAKIFQNAQMVIEKLKDDSIKDVAVIGGGYIGVELAEAFELRGKNVTLITDKNVLEGYYDQEFQHLMSKNLSRNNINVKEHEKLIELKSDENGKVHKIITDKGQYDTQMVLVCLGFSPSTNPFINEKLDMLPNGAIKVNDKQETSIPDVYAIGDCATVYNNAKDQIDYIALASNALRSGIVAAHNAAGNDQIRMVGVQGSNAINIHNLKLCSTGITAKKANELNINYDTVTLTDYIKPEFMTQNSKVTIKVLWNKDNKRILGAQIASFSDVSLAIHIFSIMIEQHYTIDRLAVSDLFFLPHFNQPHNFITKAGMEALKKIIKY